MTTITTETTQRVYVRNRGYAQLMKVHPDHSATVSYEPSSIHDGCDHPAAHGREHVPFGDWVYEPDKPYETATDIKYRMLSVLRRDLGETFIVTDEWLDTNSGAGPGLATSVRATYGPYVVKISVEHDGVPGRAMADGDC